MDALGKSSSVPLMFGVGEPAAQKVNGEFQHTNGTLDPSVTKLEFPKKPLPYNRVCSKECMGGVWIAWVFESDSLHEPVLPPFPPETDIGVREENDEICRTRKMPGAFDD
jgi:hypothetical protein